MLLSEVTNFTGTDVALQICDNDIYCNDLRLLKPNPTKTRLGFCSWCWSSLDAKAK